MLPVHNRDNVSIAAAARGLRFDVSGFCLDA